MLRIDVSFLAVAATVLIVGLCVGIGMGIAHDFQLAPVHAHLNLVGFVSLSIFGLTYKVFPALSRSRLAIAHLALSSIGAVVLPFGIYLSVTGGPVAVAIIGSFAVLGGALLFLVNLIRLVVMDQAMHTRGSDPALA